jgi:FlaA1/EpsC-like NDP-sugar epimerase
MWGLIARLRNRHLVAIDAVTLSLTPALALALCIDRPSRFFEYFDVMTIYALVALVVRLIVLYALGLYQRYWHAASVDELIQIVQAVGATVPLTFLVFAIVETLDLADRPLPRLLPIVDGALSLLAVGSPRFIMRVAHMSNRRKTSPHAKRVLIVGAGPEGQVIAREMRENPQVAMEPVAFLDDNAAKRRLRIAGVPVVGGRASLAAVVTELDIAQVIIAMANAPGDAIRDVFRLCDRVGVPAKIVPGFSQILSDTVSLSRLRDVDIEDLLRREPVRTDINAVRGLLRGARVIVTGGGGSIGSELCRQVLAFRPTALGILDHAENGVFEIHDELRRMLRAAGESSTSAPELCPIIANVRNVDRMRTAMQEFQPEVIFHAAAHKHVPLMEENPVEAAANNIFGTRNVVEAAVEAGAGRFVMISTDKAVNPTSVMGATKRAAEQIVLRAARDSGRTFVAVRFGNVLGSRGSVVPTFKQQIAQGGPVTVCHPDMTRYFMTIPEAVQLVLQASVLGAGGELFMLDMGHPVRIVDLARDLIVLSGLEVGRDIDITFTGVRPGEKLHEELLLPTEHYRKTAHEKVLMANNASSVTDEELERGLTEMWEAVGDEDAEAVRRLLRVLVPEYHPEDAATSAPVDTNQLAGAQAGG